MDESGVPEGERPRRRGIYLLPNLLTTAALSAGFFAILASMDDRFVWAAAALYVAMVLDGFDGRVARALGSASDFGKEYDSLSDMVSFGVAPALVSYQWAFYGEGAFTGVTSSIGAVVALIYTAAAAMRLARFNSRAHIQDKRFFQGLPSPAAAALIASMILLGSYLELGDWGRGILAFLVTLAAGTLMVSNFAYYSGKDLDLEGPVRFQVFALMSVLLIALFISPVMPFLLFSAFALSGPLQWLLRSRKRQSKEDDPEGGSG